MLSTSSRHRHPDIVTATGGWRARGIFGDIEIPVLIQREVVWHLEIRRSVQAQLHIVVNECSGMVVTAIWLPQVDGDDSVIIRASRHCYIQNICAPTIVARRGR